MRAVEMSDRTRAAIVLAGAAVIVYLVLAGLSVARNIASIGEERASSLPERSCNEDR